MGKSKIALGYYHQYLNHRPNLMDEKEEIEYTKARIAQLTTAASD